MLNLNLIKKSDFFKLDRSRNIHFKIMQTSVACDKPCDMANDIHECDGPVSFFLIKGKGVQYPDFVFYCHLCELHRSVLVLDSGVQEMSKVEHMKSCKDDFSSAMLN